MRNGTTNEEHAGNIRGTSNLLIVTFSFILRRSREFFRISLNFSG